MGLFSFLKNAGAKMFSGKNEKAEAPVVKSTNDNVAEMQAAIKKSRETTLEAMVKSHHLNVENLSIEVDDDKVTVYGQTENLSTKEKVILTLGNVEGIATVDDRISVIQTEPESVFYEVKKGDSLSKIAKAHYGDMMKYNIIFEANKPMLTSPDLIYPGQVLRIPHIG
ncbi:MAG: peptidoglycan-binding protein LysM [Saprospiraceae bacterium]|nr:peptidoglycan-binding protein LysM [Saprospiraceae bacterium]MBK8817796.1 peptidoglycan-binding protein LysM [Saprospiraceae bacterium]